MAKRFILAKYLAELEAKLRRCDQHEDEVVFAYMLTKGQEAVTIDHMPDNLLQCIFAHLSPKELLKVRLASRRWYHLTDSLVHKSSSALTKSSEHLSLSLTSGNREIMV